MEDTDKMVIKIDGNIGIHDCYEGVNIISSVISQLDKEKVYFAKSILFKISLNFIPGNILVLLGNCIYDLETQGKRVEVTMPESLYNFISKSGFSDYINTKKHSEGPLSNSVVLPFSRLSSQKEFTTYLEKYREYIPSSDRDIIVTYIGELHYNSIEHGDTQDIFLMSQKYPKAGYMDVTIYDAGKGILGTNKGDIFLKVYKEYCSESFYEYVKFKNGLNIFFIILCVCTRFSSKGLTEGGFGLWDLSKYLYSHKGKLSIATGNVYIELEFIEMCDMLDTDSIRYEVKELNNNIPGTYISFTFSI